MPIIHPKLLARCPGLAGNRPTILRLRVLTLVCIILALGTLVLPVALTHMPPLLDYPNHLARIWLLAGGANHAPLDGIYRVDWSGASTNIGIDLLAATLGRLIGGWALAPLLLGAAVVLPPLGAVLLNRAVFGGWHWWQAGFAVLAWNSTLLAGFLNFQIGLGLALVAAAVDPAVVRRAGPLGAVLLRIGLGTALLVFHPFAAGLYGVLLAGLAFGAGHGSPERGASLGRRAWRAALATGLGVGLPVACFLLLAPTLPGGHAPPGIYNLWIGFTPANKAATLLSAIATYDLRLDIGAILLLWMAARFLPSDPMRYHAGLMFGALGLVALALLVPSTLGGTACVDWRFPVMAILTAAAALRPGMRSAHGSQVMAVALMLLALTRTGWIAGIWQERQADVAAVEDALAFVPAGSAVLPVEHTQMDGNPLLRGRMLAVGGLPFYWHLPSLAVPLRHAFVPTLFAAPGKQPLRVLQPWVEISVLEGVPAPVRYLRAYVPSPRVSYMIGYMAHWRESFDYVLVLNAQMPDADDEASVPGLELLADRGFARIYRILSNGARSGGS